jgi:PRP38 family
MSRAALSRQGVGSKAREIHAEEVFEMACEEGRQKSSVLQLPLWGDDTSFHFNPMLLQNCILSPYFQKCCANLKDWNAVIDEIYYEVKSLQVFQVGKQPSTAFCLLLRLLTLRMTSQQLDATVKHTDSPYIRAIGFLYLRYVGQPEQIYKFIEPYLQDSEEFTIERPEQRDAKIITMGSFVRFIFQSRDFYGQTTLPRFPIAIERDLQVKLLAAEKIHERALQHFRSSDRMRQFQTVGCKVLALYGDDENPITWYEAEIDRVITRDDNGPLKYPKFVVTYTEYGNTETVTLGELDVLDGSSSTIAHRDWNQGGYTSSRDRHPTYRDSDLYDEVRRRERKEVEGSGRGSWSRRPPTTKESLAAQSYNSSNKYHISDNRSDCIGKVNSRHNNENPPKNSTEFVPTVTVTTREGNIQRGEHDTHRKRSAEEIATIAEKKRKLLAKYG